MHNFLYVSTMSDISFSVLHSIESIELFYSLTRKGFLSFNEITSKYFDVTSLMVPKLTIVVTIGTKHF